MKWLFFLKIFDKIYVSIIGGKTETEYFLLLAVSDLFFTLWFKRFSLLSCIAF
jgi:hypothetical protein